MDEIVYILTNQAMPGYTKIGITGNLETRIRQLSGTSVPVPFQCFYAKKVKNSRDVEGKLHAAFAKDRVDSGAGREFFMIRPEQAAAALSLVEGEDVTPDENLGTTEQERVALEEISRRRPVFKFTSVGIAPGSVLHFYLDESVTCVVHDERKVEFKGQIVSTSDAALQVIKSKGLNWKAVSGPGVWMYEGETLHERRLRMEQE